jgi:hypothetical protein
MIAADGLVPRSVYRSRLVKADSDYGSVRRSRRNLGTEIARCVEGNRRVRYQAEFEFPDHSLHVYADPSILNVDVCLLFWLRNRPHARTVVKTQQFRLWEFTHL